MSLKSGLAAPNSQPVSSFANQGLNVGLLGGGQLARMMILKGHELGISVHVLSPSSQDPAAMVTNLWTQGDPNNLEDLKKFLLKIDILSFESEFFDAAKIAEAIKAIHPTKKVQCFPSLENLSRLQDRAFQKADLVANGLPTSPFSVLKEATSFEEVCQQFKDHLVFKKRIGGYDGYGTILLKSSDQKNEVHQKIRSDRYNYIGEKWISFRQELSLVMARNVSGEILHYPLVQSHQEDSKCSWVLGPKKHKGLNPLIKKLKKYLDKVDYVGVIAFELFDTPAGLIINEVAPRVHNTGHFSLDACNVDQFSLHLMCLLDRPLTPIKLLSKNFCMMNLVGQSDYMMNLNPMPSLTGKLHWYGKLKNRPGRKMGHINYLGSSQNQLLKLGLSERKRILK